MAASTRLYRVLPHHRVSQKCVHILKCSVKTCTLTKWKLITNCRLCLASIQSKVYTESIDHIVSVCSAYTEVRSRILGEMKIVCKNSNTGIQFDEFKQNTNLLTQFILDCCSLNLPKRVNMNDKKCQDIFQLSRDLYHHIRKTRMEKLKELQGQSPFLLNILLL